MKRVLNFILPAALLVLAAGCMGDLQYEDSIEQPTTVRYRLSFDLPTKTVLGTSGETSRTVSWAGDETLFYYTADGEKGLVAAPITMENEVAYVTISNLSPLKDKFVNAIYCGGADSPIDPQVPDLMTTQSFVTLDVASSVPKATTFAAAHACAAHLIGLRNDCIHFSNIVSIFKFTADTDVDHIVFSGRGNEIISGGEYGLLEVTFDSDGLPTSVNPYLDYGASTVTVPVKGGSGDFYFAIIPTYFPAGFSISCYGSGNTLIKEVEYTRPLAAGITAAGALAPSVINLGKISDWKTTVAPVNPVTSLTLSHSTINFVLGDNPVELVATVNTDADDKLVTWSTNNTGVVSVETVSVTDNVTRIRITPLAKGSSTLTINTHGKDISGQVISKTVEITVSEPAPVLPDDLSAAGTANCYIVPKAGATQYRFRADVRGNDENEVIYGGYTAAILWETRPWRFYKDESINRGDVISDVSYDGQYITFVSNGAGNAMVALMNSSRTILWSWHLWVWPGYNEAANSQTYKGNAGTLLDRDLGATVSYEVTDEFDRGNWGLMYQWGRKDPFFSKNWATALGVGVSVPDPILSSEVATSNEELLDYVAANPMMYLLYPSGNSGDWMYPNRDNTLWGSYPSGDIKSIYDPCPPGWKVPSKDFWYKATGIPSGGRKYQNLSAALAGLDFAGIMANYDHVFYPVAGGFKGTSNIPDLEAYAGSWWTCAADTTPTSSTYGLGYLLSINRQTRLVTPRAIGYKSCGYAVRCMKDASSGSVTPDPGNDPDPDPGTVTEEPTFVPVEEVTVTPDKKKMFVGQTFKLGYSISPANADSTNVVWSSDKTAVATVDEKTGEVKAISPGVASIKASATDESGQFDVCVVTVEEQTSIDLGDTDYGTANCYLVSAPGDYCFKPVKGNSKAAGDVLTPNTKSAALLWQSYGTSEAVGTAIITNVEYNDGTIYFTVPTTMKNGNAVIAAYDANSTIIWSWHIWVCKDYDPEATGQVYVEHEPVYGTDSVSGDQVISSYKATKRVVATVMDRNLGALSATPGSVGAFGLMYQWGRKDPFLGSAGSNTFAVSSPSNWSRVTSSVSIEHSIAYPMQFVCTSNADWQTSGNGNLWSGTAKTMYDPCPPGWMVPKGGDDGLWAKSIGATYGVQAPINADLRGVSYSFFTESGSVWIPFAGYIVENNYTLGAVGGQLRMWSGTPHATNAVKALSFFQSSGAAVTVSGPFCKSEGCSVRCVKEASVQ